MLRVSKQYIAGLKNPVFISLTMAFASFGDAFLYPFLPQHAAEMQIPVVWVGVLLSVNRFIRILFNPLVVKLFARYDVKKVTIAAVLAAIVSTIGYGLGWGLLSLILFRIIWGIAFAILRLSAAAYAFDHAQVGLSLGTGKAIQDAGPLLALWWGPVLLEYCSVTSLFFILAFISLPALLFAAALPALHSISITPGSYSFKTPSIFSSITFATSFIIEGMLIICIGFLLQLHNSSLTTWSVTTLAAGYLAYRRICSIFFAPLGGLMADKIGFTKMFNSSLLLIITGLGFVLTGWIAIGLVLVFTFHSVNNAIAPMVACNGRHDKINAVAINASWRDMGAATGTLTGGWLLSGYLLYETFIVGIFILTLLLFIHRQKNSKG